MGVVVLTLFSGCAGTPAPQGPVTLREAQRIEAAATSQRATAAPGQVLADLRRAAQLYTLMDDTPGVVRVYLTIARIHEYRNEAAVAGRYAEAALQLSSEHQVPEAHYRALLMVGRLNTDSGRFEQALGMAQSALQKAVALTYLQRYDEAYALIANLTEPEPAELGDLAFVLHAYARSNLAQKSAEHALALYKRSDNYRGIARCLHLLGDIAAQRGEKKTAALYHARALRVEAAIDDAAGAGAVGSDAR